MSRVRPAWRSVAVVLTLAALGCIEPPEVPLPEPRGACGPRETASGPLCGGGLPCVATRTPIARLEARAIQPRIGDDGEGALLVSHAHGSTAHAMFRVTPGLPASVEEVAAPLRPSPSARFARAGDATYALGLVDAITFSPQLLRWDGGAWIAQPSDFALSPSGGDFAGDTAGCLHVLDGRTYTVLRAGEARVEELTGVRMAMALDDEGAAQFIGMNGQSLTWDAGPVGGVEIADPTAPPLEVAFVVVGRTPHIIYRIWESAPTSPREVDAPGVVRYATRSSRGWQTREIARDEITGCNPYRMPDTVGETCSFELTRNTPLGALADATGEVRLLYAEVTQRGTLEAVCPSAEDPECPHWFGTPDLDGRLHVVDAHGRDTVALEDIPITEGDAIAVGIDIHLALVIPLELHAGTVAPLDSLELVHVQLTPEL